MNIAAMAVGYAAGAACVAAGFWIMRAEPSEIAGGAVRCWRDGLTKPTAMVVGLCLLVMGYHAAAWVSPEQWPLLRVPRERWWMLALGLAAAATGSLAVDHREAKR